MSEKLRSAYDSAGSVPPFNQGRCAPESTSVSHGNLNLNGNPTPF